MADPLQKKFPEKLSRREVMEVVVPEITELDSFLYPFFSELFGRRGRITIKQGRKNVKVIDLRNDRTKNQYYEDFRREFFVEGSDGDLLVEPNMKIVFKEFKPIQAKQLQQKFREGQAHCVFTPLIKTWSEKPSKYQETILKKVIKYANKYGDNPVPQEEMEELAKKLQTTIKINTPIGDLYKTYNPKGDRTCILMNPKANHVEETNETKPKTEISHEQAIDYLQNLKDGEVVEGSFHDPIRIHTFKEIYEIMNPMKPYIKEINNLIPNIDFNATKYPEVNNFILESRIINSGTLRFQEEYDEHYDLEKAYTQFHLTKYYRGFLGVIHQFRNFTFPPTKQFLKEHNGIYKAKIIKPSPLARMLGFQENKYYILPLPEWEFHQNTKTDFTIVSGVFGSSFDFRFPESSIQSIPLRTGKLNKPFRIFAGQLSSKINENDKRIYSVKSTFEFSQHLKSLYKDVDYDEETQTARINTEIPNVYTRHHLFSFITSYTRIVMMEEMLKFDISNLSGITLDGLYFKGKAPKDLIPQFRPKKSKMSSNHSVYWYNATENTTNFPLITRFNQNTFLEGSGGSGKTHTILNDKGFNNVLYASPTHELGKDKVIEYTTHYTTIHRLIGEKCRSYKDDYGDPSVIFVDEITQIEADFINRIIALYPNSLIFIAGDVDSDGRHYQCKYSNQIWKPTFPIIKFTNDYRAKTETLKQMKQELREYMKTDPTPYEIKTYVKQKFPTITKEQAITQFKETDVWIAGTHKYIKTLPHKIYTTHSYQGKTIKSPINLYISINDMFEPTMFYTAMSRVENENQLIVVD